MILKTMDSFPLNDQKEVRDEQSIHERAQHGEIIQKKHYYQ